MILKWGIAGAGKISEDFVKALTIVGEHHRVVAVAARTKAAADAFLKYNVDRTYEGYKELAVDSNVDIVYVGTINITHYEICKLMLENGKHVLCEKPLGMNRKQVYDMIKCARDNEVFFMEAIWSRFFPVYAEVKKFIHNGVIGNVLYINASIGFPLQHVERVRQVELGGGSILDLGVYLLQLQQYIFKGVKHVKVMACGHLNRQRADDSAHVIIQHPEGRTAVLTCSSEIELPNEAVIVGTKGTIKIKSPFWCPTDFTICGEEVHRDLPISLDEFNFQNSAGLAYEAEHVRSCLGKGLKESQIMPLADSLELSEYMDMIRSAVGVMYEEDK